VRQHSSSNGSPPKGVLYLEGCKIKARILIYLKENKLRRLPAQVKESLRSKIKDFIDYLGIVKKFL
jgi:hypothetical protein